MNNLANGRISFPEFPEADYGLSTEQWEKALAGIHYLAGLNVALVPTDNPLNKYFPWIKPTTVSEVIESWREK